ncbi:Spy/CpxP family protein refolding chaperone [Microvirga subterranea]|uniref:LTXXQ motif family protein n=1 Tax=Microvirga subterranea TaxID=186651 RepID=A0A370HQY2_9HYPH|nr:Spy/CpxP family protein refolding chaperone [Microvirga subterranea]RDI60908.1 LTXXQ motif family protein [Microvirga subterranea]
MKKIVTLAAAALIAASGTYAVAQGAGPGGPGAGQERQARPERPRMSQDDFNRFVDARIAGIKAGLRLTADQERLWQPVEAAIRNNASERFTRMEQFRANRDQNRQLDFMQRLERRSTFATENAQRTSALATAMRPLWDSFNEDQKRIAPRLLQQAVGGMGWRGERRGDRFHGRDHDRMGMMHHGDRMMGRGPGMMQQGGQPAQPQNPQ